MRFQLNDGSLDGRVVLDPQSMAEMRTVPPPHAGAPDGYALGVARTRWNRWDGRPDLFGHSGGGFGFLSDLSWVPQLGIGIAILTNSADHQLQYVLAESILSDLVAEPGVYHDRVRALPWRAPVVETESFEPPAGMPNLVADAAMRASGAALGSDSGSSRLSPTSSSLTTARRSTWRVPPRYGAVSRLVRVAGGPTPWQWAMLGAVALLAALWILAAAVRAVRRLRSPSTQESAAVGRGERSSRRWRHSTRCWRLGASR